MKATLQNLLLPQLGSAKSGSLNLHSWIGENRFSDACLIGNQWHLEAYSERELYCAFTPDFQRFSFSSFETFLTASLENDFCASTGWPLIKLYYSAFFAAHSITRATGAGYINLDKKAARAVNAYLSVTESKDEISSGPYKVFIKELERGAHLILEPSNEGGGVHDGFWRYFCGFLGDLGKLAVERALPSTNSFLREIDALQACIKEGGRGGVWFSATRNAINYRHEFESWLPNNKNSLTSKLIFPASLGDPDVMEDSLRERKNELVRLINLSTYLASLNHQVILYVERETSANSVFVRKWKKLKRLGN